MEIRETTATDLTEVMLIQREAFGEEDEAILVRNLLNDSSAHPTVSLIAVQEKKAVGHILFTAAQLEGSFNNLVLSLLGPLAVLPGWQNQGVGGKLIREGLALLEQAGTDLVFVLGHPDYYPRHGFQPAGRQGLDAPYPIEEKNADAWMVQALRPDLLGSVCGKVSCADTFKRPEYWRE
jgi:putative acetyltransferase